MHAKISFSKAVIILVFLFHLCPVQALGQDEGQQKVYTINECIQKALADNWSIKAKKEAIDEAYYSKKKARSDFLPKLSTSYGYTRLSEVKKSSSIPQVDLNSQDNYQWKATVSQPLFTGYALTSAYELAKLGIDLSSAELEFENLELALKVKEAYFSILKNDKGVDVARNAVESLESHVNVARSFYDLGMIPVNDLLKAEVELANAQHTLIKAGNASQLSRAALNVLLVRPVNEPVAVEDVLAYKEESVDFDRYLSRALEGRPEIKVIDINSFQADEQIRLVKSSLYPEIALTYNYVKEGSDFSVSGSAFHEANIWQTTAGLSWTFWEWGKTSAAVSEKESLKRQLLQARKTLENNISLEIKKAILDMEETEKNIPTAKKSVTQAEENLRVSKERYKAQVATSTEVLDAQTLLSQARTNYYNALYDHQLAKALLLRAVGEY